MIVEVAKVDEELVSIAEPGDRLADETPLLGAGPGVLDAAGRELCVERLTSWRGR